MSTILLIDDEPGVRKLLRVVLERQGYVIETAKNGIEGLRKYSQVNPGLVITDLIMPDKDGLEVITTLRRKSPDMPIIAISGGGRVDAGDYLQLAQKLGCNHVLEKPIDRDTLLALVGQLLSSEDPSDSLSARSGEVRIQEAMTALSAQPNIIAMVDSIPHFYWILNRHRQVVLANQASVAMLKQGNIQGMVGRRPGEILRCEHACDTTDGCGCSKLCSTCGALKAILSAQEGEPDNRECRISQQSSGEALDLRVWASPMEFQGESLTVFQAQDIAHEKRRQALEHTFFHDLLNVAGGLVNGLEVLPELPAEEQQELVEMLNLSSREIVDGIQAHKDLLAIESGEYTLNPVAFNSQDVIQAVMACYQRHSVAEGRYLVMDPTSEAIDITSDQRLMMRVVGNMVKNALEASDQGQSVTVGCKADSGGLTFWVHNEGQMPTEVQAQVFNRSYSTKGEGRGLGTFSMRLLSERYLQGRVSFYSTSRKGTTFSAWYPTDISS